MVHRDRSGHGRQWASAKWTRAIGVPLGLRWSDQLTLTAPWGQVTVRASQSMRNAACGRAAACPALLRRVWWVSAPTGPEQGDAMVGAGGEDVAALTYQHMPHARPRQPAFIQVLVDGLGHLDVIGGRVGGLHVRDYPGHVRVAGLGQVVLVAQSSRLRA